MDSDKKKRLAEFTKEIFSKKNLKYKLKENNNNGDSDQESIKVLKRQLSLASSSFKQQIFTLLTKHKSFKRFFEFSDGDKNIFNPLSPHEQGNNRFEVLNIRIMMLREYFENATWRLKHKLFYYSDVYPEEEEFENFFSDYFKILQGLSEVFPFFSFDFFVLEQISFFMEQKNFFLEETKKFYKNYFNNIWKNYQKKEQNLLDAIKVVQTGNENQQLLEDAFVFARMELYTFLRFSSANTRVSNREIIDIDLKETPLSKKVVELFLYSIKQGGQQTKLLMEEIGLGEQSSFHVKELFYIVNRKDLSQEDFEAISLILRRFILQLMGDEAPQLHAREYLKKFLPYKNIGEKPPIIKQEDRMFDIESLAISGRYISSNYYFAYEYVVEYLGELVYSNKSTYTSEEMAEETNKKLRSFCVEKFFQPLTSTSEALVFVPELDKFLQATKLRCPEFEQKLEKTTKEKENEILGNNNLQKNLLEILSVYFEFLSKIGIKTISNELLAAMSKLEPYYCVEIIVAYIGARIPALEQHIAKDAGAILLYVEKIVKGRFELGEEVLRKIPERFAKYKQILSEVGASLPDAQNTNTTPLGTNKKEKTLKEDQAPKKDFNLTIKMFLSSEYLLFAKELKKILEAPEIKKMGVSFSAKESEGFPFYQLLRFLSEKSKNIFIDDEEKFSSSTRRIILDACEEIIIKSNFISSLILVYKIIQYLLFIDRNEEVKFLKKIIKKILYIKNSDKSYLNLFLQVQNNKEQYTEKSISNTRKVLLHEIHFIISGVDSSITKEIALPSEKVLNDMDADTKTEAGSGLLPTKLLHFYLNERKTEDISSLVSMLGFYSYENVIKEESLKKEIEKTENSILSSGNKDLAIQYLQDFAYKRKSEGDKLTQSQRNQKLEEFLLKSLNREEIVEFVKKILKWDVYARYQEDSLNKINTKFRALAEEAVLGPVNTTDVNVPMVNFYRLSEFVAYTQHRHYLFEQKVLSLSKEASDGDELSQIIASAIYQYISRLLQLGIFQIDEHNLFHPTILAAMKNIGIRSCIEIAARLRRHAGINIRFRQIENFVAHDPQGAYWYASDVLGGAFPEGEKAIAQSLEYSFLYAVHILRSRFPLGEEAISKSSEHSLVYAIQVLRSRFPKGEGAIAKDAQASLKYAKEVLRGRFEAGESEMKKSPNVWNEYVQFLRQVEEQDRKEKESGYEPISYVESIDFVCTKSQKIKHNTKKILKEKITRKKEAIWLD